MQQYQRTLKHSVTLSGTGLHTGINVKLTIEPSSADSGIKFCRIDLENQPIIPALAEYVVDTSRGTSIEKEGARVSTIEHLMSSFWGLGIDNALVKIDATELPIFDGSSKQYIEVLSNNIEELTAPRNYFEVKEKIVYEDKEKGVEIILYPDDEFCAQVQIDFNSKVLGNQYARLDKVEQFSAEVANCRTFVFFHELAYLRKNELIKGGSVENAIVVVEGNPSEKDIDLVASLFHKEGVKPSQGYLNNLELRFDNEPARHKMMDLLGDLYLIGMPIKGRIIALRPGHLSNTNLAKNIRKDIKRNSGKPIAPVYNPNIDPLFDVNEIKKRLPHRPPFLLVDKILSLTDTEVIGIKNVTMNEPFFVGHFPEKPVMPGVLIIEAMAQCGGILVLGTVPDPENYLTYFLKIDGVKFKKQVLPGDTLLFRLKLMEPIRRGLAHMSGQAFVGDSLATEGELLAQISKVTP